jgi:hypothetical protein
MKKKRMIMKILKKEWFIWKFWKRGGSREKGGGGNEIHAPSACAFIQWKLECSSLWRKLPENENETITFNFRIIDGHIEFPYCMLFFDKSNKRSIKLETAVTWSKYNLNMMNIYEESTINFWIWCRSRV